MIGSAERPLLFLDVDGPLIPFGAASQEYPAYQAESSPQTAENPLLARINPEQDARRGLHWKTRTLVAWAAGRPFGWFDDEITDKDRAWVSAHHPGPALPHRIDPSNGITEADYSALEEWLADAVERHLRS